LFIFFSRSSPKLLDLQAYANGPVIMRFHFGILLCFLVINVSAGGTRAAYERMFVWFAYQAEIDYLWNTEGNLNNLQICHSKQGTGPRGGLTFNEFVQYTNLGTNGQSGQKPQVQVATTLQVDRTAQNLFRNRNNGWLAPRWQIPNNIIRSANGRYDNMLFEVSRVVWDIKSKGIDNSNLRSAIDAIQKVVITREIDYERYRMPALKASSDFTGSKKVTWVTDQLVIKYEAKAEKIDIPATEANNPSQPSIAQRIDTWEKNTYFADENDGVTRSNHKQAILSSQRCENMAKTGHC
jgi:hypothetical protein